MAIGGDWEPKEVPSYPTGDEAITHEDANFTIGLLVGTVLGIALSGFLYICMV